MISHDSDDRGTTTTAVTSEEEDMTLDRSPSLALPGHHRAATFTAALSVPVRASSWPSRFRDVVMRATFHIPSQIHTREHRDRNPPSPFQLPSDEPRLPCFISRVFRQNLARLSTYPLTSGPRTHSREISLYPGPRSTSNFPLLLSRVAAHSLIASFASPACILAPASFSKATPASRHRCSIL